jgi:Zn-dependent peptidase ImmA (M78 family)/DNA-binding XRE family transcriptional regulator
VEFNPARLALARRRRGLMKVRLAEAVGISTRILSAYENGGAVPSADTLRRLAHELRFPTEFFSGPTLEEPAQETASFRSLSTMTAGQRDAALGAGALAMALGRWIAERFNLPGSSIPDCRGMQPEAAADAVRTEWALGSQPVRNMVHLLEAKGARAFSLAEQGVEVDAFSLWKGGTPYVFLNTQKSAEHSRFDAAHELGHLVLHRHGAPEGREAEREADAFASAFLMPRASVQACQLVLPSIERLIRLKKNWGVSVMALTHRLHTLGILSDWHYRTLCIEMTQRGYRRAEPEGLPRETSQVLAKVFAALREEGVTKGDVARQLCLDVTEVDSLVFGLVLTQLPGSGGGRRQSSSPVKLRVV